MTNNKGAFGYLVKGFMAGAIAGMVAIHLLCNVKSKKKLKHNAEIAGENFCSMFKMK